eukprot:IDg4668t1
MYVDLSRAQAVKTLLAYSDLRARGKQYGHTPFFEFPPSPSLALGEGIYSVAFRPACPDRLLPDPNETVQNNYRETKKIQPSYDLQKLCTAPGV